MASLQSSFTLAATRNCPFQKPSHPGNATQRSHRLEVRCSGGGRVDRRHMLLGLGGGLYSAGSLVSDRRAEAFPIVAPDVSKCDTTGATTTKDGQVVALDVNCCPIAPDSIVDYELPFPMYVRYRRAAHHLTPEQVTQFEQAIQRMRDLDVSDPLDPRGFMQQANVHCAYCNGPYDQRDHPGIDLQVHNSWIFFAWHRWYIYFFERIVAHMMDDQILSQNFGLPYWNYDHPDGMHIPPIYDNPPSPLYDANRNQNHRGEAYVQLQYDRNDDIPVEQILKNNDAQMYNEMIGTVLSPWDFYGAEYRDGDAPHGFAQGGTVERGSHTGVHRWVGDPRNLYNEDMGNFYSSGRDPLFYALHANVDRMWTLWRAMSPYGNEPMDCDLMSTSFVFYDERRRLVRVKAADCFRYQNLGYEYEVMPTPWTEARPVQRTVPASLEKLSNDVKTASELFPLTPATTVKVVVAKPSKGRADEVLVLENVVSDNSKLVKFNVFVNDDEDAPDRLDRAEFAGAFTQLPHRVKAKESVNNVRFNLKELYENINIPDDDDKVVITIVPHINGDAVTISGIKIVPRVAT